MGPFKLLRAVGPVAFAVELPRGWRIHNVFHVSLFKLVSPHLRYKYPKPVRVVDGIPEWQVRQVLSDRSPKRGQKEFLIAWTGFGPEWNSWIKESKLQSCAPDLLKKYFEKRQEHPELGTAVDEDQMSSGSDIDVDK